MDVKKPRAVVMSCCKSIIQGGMCFGEQGCVLDKR